MTDLQYVTQPVGQDDRMMTPFFSYVAHEIGAKELAVPLEELSILVKDHRKMAKADPRAKHVRGDYKRLKKAAVAMERAVDRASNRLPWWWSSDERDKLSAHGDATREVAELFDKVSARIPYGGRKRAQRIAALIIIEAWTLVHGEPPGAHNLRVQGICDTYWRACGAAPIGKRGGPENWRRTMGAALKDNSAMRWSIRDHLQRKVLQNEF
jgi:hypothetical protein